MELARPLPTLPFADRDAPDASDSGVGIKELISNDAEIVKQYRDLAIRHNALVEDVMKFLARQAK